MKVQPFNNILTITYIYHIIGDIMNKKILLFLLILISVCAISHVSAEEISDAADDVIAADDADIDKDVLSESPNEVLSNGTGVVSNDTGSGSNGTGDVPVEKQTATIKASKATVAYKKSTLWSLKVTDSNGKAVSNKNILLKIYTGSKYKVATVATDAQGVAKYNTKSLAAGTHKIVASLADDSYNCKEITSSVKVVKQTPLKIIAKAQNAKDGSVLVIFVMNKKTKKLLNGVKLKLLIYTGKKYKTVTLKTKKFRGMKGVTGYATNKLKVGKHKVKITPVSFKYKGSKTTSMKIKKSAKKYPGYTVKI